MAPEFEYNLKIHAESLDEAKSLCSFIQRIRGVSELLPVTDKPLLETPTRYRSRSLQITNRETLLNQRLAFQLSQIELGEIAKYSDASISLIETGKIKRISKGDANRLAAALGISIEDFTSSPTPSRS